MSWDTVDTGIPRPYAAAGIPVTDPLRVGGDARTPAT